jgi:serine phosphatase RsbU (regulator of sigma subunit)
MIKILVVDDIEANRILLRRTLTTISSYQVFEAAGGSEALQVFEKETPDLILMDINMPGMDGYQVTSKIKSLIGDNYVPVIFVTALSSNDSLATALASGGDDFISKPFDVGLLESKINAHLRIRELNQQLSNKNEQLVHHNQILSHEHELINHFFENALKKSFLDKDVIRYHISPMSAFNGDLLLVERGPQGGIYLLLGDFTGHGLTAAMGTLPTAMIFFKMVSKGAAIDDIAHELNHQLNSLLPCGMFLTASLLEINPRGDTMSLWMGGMPESYWIGKNGKLKGLLHSKHMPIGILDDDEFEADVEILSVEHGDKIYLYSDGIPEAQRSDGEIFGNDRLTKILTTQTEDRFAQVLSELNSFTGSTDQNDDITLVEMTCTSVSAAEQSDVSDGNQGLTLPWHISISVSAAEMREGNPVNHLSDMLGSLPVLGRHKGVIHVLLSEMYANALDYSILGLAGSNKVDETRFVEYYESRAAKLSQLDDATINFDFSYISASAAPSLKIRMSDTGHGYQGHSSASNDQPHGRGLDILRSLCETLSFSDEGRTLEVLYRL